MMSRKGLVPTMGSEASSCLHITHWTPETRSTSIFASNSVCNGGNFSESTSLLNFIRAVDPENILRIERNRNKGVKCNSGGTTVIEIRLVNLNLTGILDVESLCKLPNLALANAPSKTPPIKAADEVQPQERRIELVFFVEPEERFKLEDLLEATAGLRTEGVYSSLYNLHCTTQEQCHFCCQEIEEFTLYNGGVWPDNEKDSKLEASKYPSSHCLQFY
ncbi:Uncharacterized protein Adt_46771 [Abeliophyllum distichum]|uniref:Uncharacterized protein n=1 Tax=Abeliophyllum distichum TaxID=126358 RepID=A0ABD1NY02_9LAMI